MKRAWCTATWLCEVHQYFHRCTRDTGHSGEHRRSVRSWDPDQRACSSNGQLQLELFGAGSSGNGSSPPQ